MASIGFIGASGLMGHGMARHLLAKGHALGLTVHRNRERVADLLAAGATEAATPRALAEAAEIVFVCVTGSPQVEAVVRGSDGLLAAGRAGLVIVDCSTSEPSSSSALREAAAAAGATFVDAPLARTPVEAEQGRLNVMVGAEAATFARLEPVLRCFAENVFHVGGPGAGHTVKLLNNFIAQAICTATAEAFAVGVRAGIDPRKLVELVSAAASTRACSRRWRRPSMATWPASASSWTTPARTSATTRTSPKAWPCRRSSGRRCTSRSCWRARSATAASSCPRSSRRRSS
jgi:3-hydroxyisobutyrate dehydrogenase-like beta-hydroxyacid dehydrogenase